MEAGIHFQTFSYQRFSPLRLTSIRKRRAQTNERSGNVRMPVGPHLHWPTGWWQIFNDPELNSLEAQAVAANQDLERAVAHATEARALQRVSKSELAVSALSHHFARQNSWRRLGRLKVNSYDGEIVVPVTPTGGPHDERYARLARTGTSIA
jgi:hypothetical protein